MREAGSNDSFDEERHFNSQPPQEEVSRQMAELKQKNNGRVAHSSVKGALLPAPQAVQLAHLTKFGTRFA